MKNLTAAEFEDLLGRITERATVAATSNVATMLSAAIPRRVLAFAVTLAFIVGAGLALPTTLILSHENALTAKGDAHANCESQREARPQSNARAFVQQITLELAEDAFLTFPRRFREAEIAKINGKLPAAEKTAPGQLPVRVRSLSDLTAVIRPLPLINCESQIGG